MSQSRKKYTKEFKLECVQYLLKYPDKTNTEVASELGIKQDVLSRWKREYEQNSDKAFPGNGNPVEAELFQLRKELSSVKEERDILKKALAIFSKIK
jgi:transposase